MLSKPFYDYMVYSDGTFVNAHGKQVKMHIHYKNGVYQIGLKIDNKRKTFIVARLLYWLFVDPFNINDKNLCIVPKDGNKLNINIDNLQLINRKDLIQGEKHKSIAKLTDKDIEDIKKMYKGNQINSNQHTKTGLSLQDIAKLYGVSKKEIHFIINGESRNKEKYKLK